ncbi:MAG: hypothetical protein A3J73_03850 [Planctomycetes bacterium RIFCSPHIGHO2_02_FULL_38_41]|nr:MAG: hypothetical protein A3J73_03850 [Planctomycetes bacterium RIFCSPHIGHO2_02_FULL_38_41]OHB98469.1 MAG: hypothetical protein A2W74_09645 [Planctomycetes bacterium RIFCSPLOWO2_12_38_17]
MKCPHCLESFHDFYEVIPVGNDADGNWGVVSRKCPSCERVVLVLVNGKIGSIGGRSMLESVKGERLIYPRIPSRVSLPKEVPEEFAEVYREACVVLSDSPKASAALSRRCLQRLLREKAHVKQSNLTNEIQEVIDSGNLPSYIVEAIDAVRKIGNYTAHLIKSERTGEIVDVEPGEADWNLDVLEALFNYYFVQPATIKKKREILNLKLKETDKKGMKKV